MTFRGREATGRSNDASKKVVCVWALRIDLTLLSWIITRHGSNWKFILKMRNRKQASVAGTLSSVFPPSNWIFYCKYCTFNIHTFQRGGGRPWSSNHSLQTSHHREICRDNLWTHRIIGLCWLCTGRRESGGKSVSLLLKFPSISCIYLRLPRRAGNSISIVLQNVFCQSFEEAKEEPRGGSRLDFQNPLNAYKTFRSICICKKLTKRKVTYNLTTF